MEKDDSVSQGYGGLQLILTRQLLTPSDKNASRKAANVVLNYHIDLEVSA